MDQRPVQDMGSERSKQGNRIARLILMIILTIGAYLRFIGINWDDFSHPHPDERFLTMVETALELPTSLGEYFDTHVSKLNPHNVGYGFFVYGTLPIFIVRYLAEWLSQTGYDEIHLVGRAASASFDLVSILLVYLIGAKLYRKRVGLLAAAFCAFSVMLIQLSHFFVVDPFANTFILLGIYFAVRVWERGQLWDYALFGLAFGMAMACKISSLPLALVLVIAVGARSFRIEKEGIFRELLIAAPGLIVAVLASVLAFRIFQPYAFNGPSIFGVLPNDRWLANMAEIRRQQAGNVDFPPALQWAMRTPVLFALKNMVLWGMGAPLGLVAWFAWGWALWRLLRAWDWRFSGLKQPQQLRHAILVIWTGIYFLWQSTNSTPSMRYQIPVYPTLAILAAWAIWEAWDTVRGWGKIRWRIVGQALVGFLSGVTLISTAAWAFAFVRIYQEPHSQVQASQWIFEHIPAGIDFVLDSNGEEILQPGAIDASIMLDRGLFYDIPFSPEEEGDLLSVSLYISPVEISTSISMKIMASIYSDGESKELLAWTTWEGTSAVDEISFDFAAEESTLLTKSSPYILHIEVKEGNPFSILGQAQLRLFAASGEQIEPIDLPRQFSMLEGVPYITHIKSLKDGQLKSILLPYVRPLSIESSPLALEVEVLDRPDAEKPLARASYQRSEIPKDEIRLDLPVDQAIPISAGETYYLRIVLSQGGGIRLRGSVLVNESGWDMTLPFRISDRDGYGGYYTGVSQEIYWPDDQDDDHDGISDKLDRIVRTLSEGDAIMIGTNRQYGTIARVPIRYPLSTLYYRELFDCGAGWSVEECAAKAQPGEIDNRLGYELIAVFESNPTLGPLEISDQAAEEAFTVYDHPKVLIFQKDESYSASVVRDLLEDVDVSNVVNAPPKQLSAIPPNLMLPVDRWQEQQSGGTWSELFSSDGLINRFHPLTVTIWWIFIGLIGLLVFPITRVVFPGLAHKGYALSRVVGLVILGWGTWILGSARVPFERPTILLVFAAMILVSLMLAWRDREELLRYFRDHRKEILWIEALALALFLLDLGIRLGNPDLWHPYKGGEKPMNFSYLNAVLKSTSFPPYDPWYAGGYINYYYYGYVIIGVPIKLLGIMPSIAYNLAIPTIFSLLAIGGYCIGYNLMARFRVEDRSSFFTKARIAGLLAIVALVLIGNMGTGRLIYESIRDLGGWSKEVGSGFGRDIPYVFQGLARYMTGAGKLSIGIERWYWDPTRAIEAGPLEAGPINEFPFFTFLYADLHAHMIDWPITLAALAWGLSWLLWARSQSKSKPIDSVLSLSIGGMILGALKPANTWDYPTFWALAAIAVVASTWYRRRKIRSEPRWVNVGLRSAGDDWDTANAGGAQMPNGASPAQVNRADVCIHHPEEERDILPGTSYPVEVNTASAAESIILKIYREIPKGSRLLEEIPLSAFNMDQNIWKGDWQVPQEEGKYILVAEPTLSKGKPNWRMWLEGVLTAVFLIGLAHLLYQPYNLWYQQGYKAVELWPGSKTSLGDYLVVHGIFLFFLITWMVWETREWMAATPISALNRFRARGVLILIAACGLIIAFIFIASPAFGYPIIPIALGVMIWAGLLILRPQMPLEKRVVLFMIGTAAAITIMVEVIVLRGDIGRMNTVFKFYLQVWTLFSLSSAAALFWILSDISRWSKGLQIGWGVFAAGIVLSAFLYPLTATPAKIKDRMVPEAPHSLDGMLYMQYATYYDIAGPMDLQQDYQAIRWMQENIKGSPVIIEANTPEYRWGSRYTVYTGLPGVLGWNWHQRQQRGFAEAGAVEDRAQDIAEFYTADSLTEAIHFLQQYDVEYIVVGLMEKQYFEIVKPCWPVGDGSTIQCDKSGWPMGMEPPDVPASDCWAIDANDSEGKLVCPTHGFDKFELMQEQGLLEVVYSTEETTIYRVWQ